MSLELEPDNPVGYFRLGLLERLQKQNDAALASFEKALALNPRLMDVFSNIVSIHAAQKDFAAAMQKCLCIPLPFFQPLFSVCPKSPRF